MSLEQVDWSTLPQPIDDGAAKHLNGHTLPSLLLPATSGEPVDLSLINGRSIVYAYPMTGRPDTPLPQGWDMIPGARGCTPQSCAFRDHMSDLKELNVSYVFGLSTQTTEYQQEAASRLQLPYPLLSDSTLSLQQSLDLPTMEVENQTLLKRLTLVIDSGIITHTFYPVFPPDQNAAEVIDWLSNNRSAAS